MRKTIAVSGGFDPVHIGHIRMFQEASKIGNVVVILNSDDFLLRKKGKVFMPHKERKEILAEMKSVFSVIDCIDEDQTVCKTLEELKPDFFANGGDRTDDNVPEKEICEKLGIKLLFGIGGGKIQSSSHLISCAKQ